MTVLDDDRLAALLTSAGDAFEVPASGMDDILARASGRVTGPDPQVGEGEGEGEGDGTAGGVERTGDAPGRVRRLVTLVARHRVVAAAACVAALLVAAGAIGALAGRTSPRTVTATLPARSPAGPRGAATTTTLPATARAPHAASGAPAAPTFGSRQLGSDGVQNAAGSSRPGSGTATTSPTVPVLPKGAVGQSAKIEQSGSLTLRVGRGRLDHAMAQLTAVATANGGFVASSETQSGAGSGAAPSGSVTLQVPVGDFGAALSQAQALGTTSSLSTKATDVTGQSVDLQARIAALEASRQQYLTILAKATTVGDVLAVQEQIDGIQTQIEQLQGQLQVLDGETTYSTLNVTVSEGTPPPAPTPGAESGLTRAWHDSVSGFVAGVEGLVRVAGPLLFALLCLGVLVVGGRALWRRWQRRRL